VPELPETETIARDLDRAIAGQQIVGAHVSKRDVLREVDAAAFARRVTGQAINAAWRRAKLIVLDLSSGDRIVVQPRFTGALLIDAGSLPERERRYSTLEMQLEDGRVLHYRDIRRLGTVALMSAARFEAYVAPLGVEPLDRAFTGAHLSTLLRGSKQAVKKVLMDQRVVAGIGNIYANEALWRAGIDPSRAANRVPREEAAALREPNRSRTAARVSGTTATRAEARERSSSDSLSTGAAARRASAAGAGSSTLEPSTGERR